MDATVADTTPTPSDGKDAEALQRRRLRNRDAQRRFRQKRSLARAARQDNAFSLHVDYNHDVQVPQETGLLTSPILLGNFPMDCTTGPPHQQYNDPAVLDLAAFSMGWDPGDNATADLWKLPPPGAAQTDEELTEAMAVQIPSSVSTAPTQWTSTVATSKAQAQAPEQAADAAASCWVTPLHIAAKRGNNRIVRLLLEQHVDPNERDSQGRTPLMRAVVEGHEDVVRSLLSHGAAIGQAGHGEKDGLTAVHLAVMYRRDAILGLLLSHSQDHVDRYADCGRTPLHIAIDIGFEAGVLLLLQQGADPQRKARHIVTDDEDPPTLIPRTTTEGSQSAALSSSSE